MPIKKQIPKKTTKLPLKPTRKKSGGCGCK